MSRTSAADSQFGDGKSRRDSLLSVQVQVEWLQPANASHGKAEPRR